MARFKRRGGYRSDHGPEAESLKIELILNTGLINELTEAIKERKYSRLQLQIAYHNYRRSHLNKTQPLTELEKSAHIAKIDRVNRILAGLCLQHKTAVARQITLKNKYREAYTEYYRANGINTHLIIGSWGYIPTS